MLQRAVASVYAQKLQEDWKLDIVIVDDGSPSPPELDVKGDPPEKISLRVMTRSNGGPAAARNTGLNSVPSSTDYVAFLDSDDQWSPDHLDHALTTLEDDADFYFSDQSIGMLSGHATHFEELCFQVGGPKFETSGLPAKIVARSIASPVISALKVPGSYVFKEDEGLGTLLRIFLPHISTSVIRFPNLALMRFRTDLRAAGEDYFYFLTVAACARKVCFSNHIGAIRGRGVSMYRDALDWDDPRSLNIILDNYRSLRLANKTLNLSATQRRIIKRRISFRRLEFVARLASDVKAKKSIDRASLLSIIQADPLLLPLTPFILAHSFVRRARGKPIVDHMRVNELP